MLTQKPSQQSRPGRSRLRYGLPPPSTAEPNAGYVGRLSPWSLGETQAQVTVSLQCHGPCTPECRNVVAILGRWMWP